MASAAAATAAVKSPGVVLFTDRIEIGDLPAITNTVDP